MHWLGQGDADRAKAVVWETNPLPATCGMVCDQKCRGRCTRGLFDAPLAIRDIKRFIVENGRIPAADPASLGDATRVAVVGAGPAGLAAARELARAGFWVEVFEANAGAGGLAATLIPGFRLGDAALDDDVARLKAMGVIFRFGQAVDAKRLAELLAAFQLVFLAGGAGKGRKLLIPEEEAAGVFDALEFLAAVKRGETPEIGRQVVVIGGGNSAMDAARTARRLCGADGRVTVVYRRTLAEMPAAPEEIREALAEGVRIMELTGPLRIEAAEGKEWALLCSRMELRKAGGGRPHPVPVFGSEFELTCDAVIVAVGQDTEQRASRRRRVAGRRRRRPHHPPPPLRHRRRAQRPFHPGAGHRRRQPGGRPHHGGGGPDDGRPRRRPALRHELAGAHAPALAARPPARRRRSGARGDPLRRRPGFSRRPPASTPRRRGAKPSAASTATTSACCASASAPTAPWWPSRSSPGSGRCCSAPGARTGPSWRRAASSGCARNTSWSTSSTSATTAATAPPSAPPPAPPTRTSPIFSSATRISRRPRTGFSSSPRRPAGPRVLQARVNGELQQLRRYPDRLDFENQNCLLRLQPDYSYLAADWRREADPAFDGRLLAQMAILLEFLPPFLHGDTHDV